MGSCNCIPKKSEQDEMNIQAGSEQILDKEKQEERTLYHGNICSYQLEDNKPATDEFAQLVRSTKSKKKKLPKILMSNGGWYEGEWLNGMRDGEGVHVFILCATQYWAEGSYYEGQWKEDKA